MADAGLDGQRIVLGMYAILVIVAGAFGALLPLVVDNLRSPAYLFLIELPATSLGLATYGALTVGTILAVPLVAVMLASRCAIDGEDSSEPG